MRKSIEKVLERALRSFYEWLSYMELSSGRLHANPLISLLSCIAVVSLASFSSRIPQIIVLMIISSLILIICDHRNFKRSLKASIVWLAFATVIMLPRIIHEIGGVLLPLRVAAAVLTLNTFIELLGTRRLLGGLDKLLTPLIGKDLSIAFEIMMIQIGKYVRSLSKLLLAKTSRLIEGRLIGDYSIISLTASELFFRGPRDAFNTSLVLRSRVIEAKVSNSLRDTLILLAVSFTYTLIALLA
ncbi:MAG: hypothetical protein NZ992_02805 [Candidatus Korarchaeum sp.]|nr:hypothetical protein [Candidatus Korarchaeum sp.]MDW8035477.1 hypothetical protein [Candidatus Korarchaeum sp.]